MMLHKHHSATQIEEGKMENNIEELTKRHQNEIRQFIKDCPHLEVKIEDCTIGFGHRKITLRCSRCGLNLLTYFIDGSMSYLSYV